MIAFIIGFLFGFVGSMPIGGPIAALVFARGIEGRFKSGIYIALGCAVAESAYAALAFWGFSKFLAQYPLVVPISQATAAVILLALGLVFVRYQGKINEDTAQDDGLWHSFVLGFSITALNPTLIATWAAATTTLFSTELVRFEAQMALPFGLGAAVGIASWFALLIHLVRRYRERFQVKTLETVIRAMGVFLIAVSGYFVLQFLSYLIGE